MAECIEEKCKKPRVQGSKYCKEHLPGNPSSRNIYYRTERYSDDPDGITEPFPMSKPTNY